MFHDNSDPAYIRISLAFRETVQCYFSSVVRNHEWVAFLQVHFINALMYLDMFEIAQNIIERDNPLH